jgi:hypothetical protein
VKRGEEERDRLYKNFELSSKLSPRSEENKGEMLYEGKKGSVRKEQNGESTR